VIWFAEARRRVIVSDLAKRFSYFGGGIVVLSI